MNFREEKKDVLLEAVKDIRKKIRRKAIAHISREQRKMAQEERYPYEGLWLTLPQITALQKKLKWKDCIVLAELLLLFVFTPILTYVIYRLMIWQLLPR